MFLKRQRRVVDGAISEYWTLVKTVRTAQGPRNQVVACLGKLDTEAVQRAQGWSDLAALLDGQTRRALCT